MQDKPATAPPRRHRFTAARLDLGWWEWGDAAAPPLVLVHGARDHGRSWQDVAERLAGRWRVVAPDLRGHGTSSWADGGAYGMEDFVYDLHRLMVVLGVSADRPVSLIGHSLGGNIALRWTGLFPDRVRRLAVIEGLGSSPARQAEEDAVPLADRLREWIATRARREGRDLPVHRDLDAATARMQQAHPGFAPALARRLAEQGTVPAEGGGLRFAHDPLLLAHNPVEMGPADKAVLWRAITCPVLLVYGRDSWASDPSQDGRAAHFRHVRVSLYDRAGHWVHHDRLDDFVDEAAAFLA